MNKSKTTQLSKACTNNKGSTGDTIKIANLSPYLVQIEVLSYSKQKRKRMKSVLRENGSKSKNESSSKSFRIKERSTTSLHSTSKKQLNNKTIISLITKKAKQRKNQISPHRNRSSQKYQIYTPSSTFTIKADHSRTLSRNDAIDVRQNNNNDKKGPAFRRAKFESRSRNQVIDFKDQNKETIEVSKYGTKTLKIGYTDDNIAKKDQGSIAMQKVTQNGQGCEVKKKFRRGKYEELYSSVKSNEMNQPKQEKQIIKSESRLDQIKRQEGIHTHNDDIMAERQIQKAHRQIRNKQFERSLHKSTEKYLKQTSYRPTKTNNDIEIYVSIIKNPSINRQSNASTLHTLEKAEILTSSIKNKRQANFLDYDFDFREENQSFSGITQMSNPSEQQSLHLQEQTSFERQRKKALKEYFNKKSPMVDWSEQDCQIDDS